MSTHPHTPKVEPLWQRLHDEHQRMGTILEDVRALVERGSYGSAARRFGEFRICEERHMREEEALLRLLPYPLPGTEELFLEHPPITRLMDELSAAISRWEVETFRTRLGELQVLLAAHHEREHRALPVAERQVRPEDLPTFEEQLSRLTQS